MFENPKSVCTFHEGEGEGEAPHQFTDCLFMHHGSDFFLQFFFKLLNFDIEFKVKSESRYVGRPSAIGEFFLQI